MLRFNDHISSLGFTRRDERGPFLFPVGLLRLSLDAVNKSTTRRPLGIEQEETTHRRRSGDLSPFLD